MSLNKNNLKSKEDSLLLVKFYIILFDSMSMFILPIIVSFLERYHFWRFLLHGENIPTHLNSWKWVSETYLQWFLIGLLLSMTYRIFIASIYLD